MESLERFEKGDVHVVEKDTKASAQDPRIRDEKERAQHRWSNTQYRSRSIRKWHPLTDCAIMLSGVAFIYWWFGALFGISTLSRISHEACSRIHLCQTQFDLEADFFDVVTRPKDLSNDSRILREIPQYVLDYAPLVHLYSEEQFWPCDIAEHLKHVTPELNYTPIQGRLQYSNLTNLDRLNDYENGRYVYLTSNDNVEERPDWLGGQKNIPEEYSEEAMRTHMRDFQVRAPSKKSNETAQGGRSEAPAVLLTVNKGKGVVDAFWFYFYSYNLGNKVFNVRFGNHVGDWEHSLIRFQHGKPKLVFFSEHFFGEAYTYDAVEKIGQRVSTTYTQSFSFVINK